MWCGSFPIRWALDRDGGRLFGSRAVNPEQFPAPAMFFDQSCVGFGKCGVLLSQVEIGHFQTHLDSLRGIYLTGGLEARARLRGLEVLHFHAEKVPWSHEIPVLDVPRFLQNGDGMLEVRSVMKEPAGRLHRRL